MPPALRGPLIASNSLGCVVYLFLLPCAAMFLFVRQLVTSLLLLPTRMTISSGGLKSEKKVCNICLDHNYHESYDEGTGRQNFKSEEDTISIATVLTLTALGGGGLEGASKPPRRQILLRTRNCHAVSRAASWLKKKSLTDILTPSLWKSDLPLWSHVTLCDQRSTWKVIIFSFCVQKWQSESFILACKSNISNIRNHKTIKYINIKKQ